MKKILFVFFLSLVTYFVSLVPSTSLRANTYLLSPRPAFASTNLEFRGRDAIVSGAVNGSYNVTRVNIVLNGTVINGGSVPTNNAAYQTLAEKLAYIKTLKARLGLNH